MALTTRRRFVQSLAVATAAAASGCTAPRSAAATPPNVLFVMCDDLAAHVLHREPLLRTRHYRRLRERGVTFTNAHCPTPLCSPARAALFSGLYPHTTGFHGYNQNHPDASFRNNPRLSTAPTLFERFKSAGYTVAGTGKLFHNGHEDQTVWSRDPRRPSEPYFGAWPTFGPMPWDGQSQSVAGWMPHPALPPPFNDLAARQWSPCWGPFSRVPEVPPDPARGTPGYRGWACYTQPWRYVSDDDHDPTPDQASVAFCADFLRDHRAGPFLLACGFNQPHTPLYTFDRHFALFPEDKVQLPPARPDDLDDCATALRPGGRAHAAIGYGTFERFRRCRDPQALRDFYRAYLACVETVDENLGRLLDALDASPHADNTIVVFTADHGFHFGEKNYVFKNTLWEPSTHVPLVIAAPRLAAHGRSLAHPVSTVHVLETLRDLCGLPVGAPNQGVSLRPLLGKASQATWQGPVGALTSIAAEERIPPQGPAQKERQHYSLRTEHWRYIRCADGDEELYDHRNDPHEWTNLARDPAHAATRESLHRAMTELLTT